MERGVMEVFFRPWVCAAGLVVLLAGPVSALDSDGIAPATSEDSTMVEIRLRDGSQFRGRVVSESDALLVLDTSVGHVEIELANIVDTAVLVPGNLAGSYWRPSANQTRLFFAPTGRNLGAGEGYLADYYVFFPSVTYGVTDRFTVSGGMSVFPGAGLEQLYYAGAKLGMAEWENGGAGIGLLAMRPGWEASDPFGIVYGVSTFGNERSSATVGIGFGYYGRDLADSPLFMLGGEARTSERIALVTENYVGMDLGDAAIISYGFRFLAKSMTVDFGFWSVMESGAGFFPGIPYIDFVFTF